MKNLGEIKYGRDRQIEELRKEIKLLQFQIKELPRKVQNSYVELA